MTLPHRRAAAHCRHVRPPVRVLSCALFALAASLLIANAVVAQTSIPRAAGGQPDLSGIWQALTTANWNIEIHDAMPGPPALGAIGSIPPGMGIVDGGEIPYTAAGREQQQRNFANRWQDDPELKCYLPGIPRANYLPQPFQIFQSPQDILFAYQYAGASRVVNMSRHREAAIDSWMGTSNGSWDGDTLVVNVQGFTGQQWLDRAGNHHSYRLQVEERFTALDANTLAYEATLSDPDTYTRPWTMRFNLHRVRERNAAVMEFACVEFTEELLYGEFRRQPEEGN